MERVKARDQLGCQNPCGLLLTEPIRETGTRNPQVEESKTQPQGGALRS